MSRNLPRILLCAGVFYPDVGGPAIHVMKIAEKLVKQGYKPIILAYGDDIENKDFGFKIVRVSRKYNKAVQWLLYFFFVLYYSFSAKLVYAFDPTAAGLPACIATWVWRKPFLIRIGGDPIWEREAELGRRIMPIVNYYEKEHKNRVLKHLRRRAKDFGLELVEAKQEVVTC